MSNPTPSQALAVFEQLGFTPEQARILLNARVAHGDVHSVSDDLLEEFANRVSATGLTADMAGYWANRLEQGFDGHDAAKELVERTVLRLRQGPGLTHGEGVVLAAEVVAALAEIRKASANVIDTTAVTLPSEPAASPQRQTPAGGFPFGGVR